MSKFSISLSVDSGPKKGETLDRKPGSVIRIGRVVKGNTLAIKDPSISQKHFTIEFDLLVSRWVLTDLTTSNATSVNGGHLSGSSVPLSDGDVIQIGESTSISVSVSPIERGNGGRRTRNRKEDGILESNLDGKVEVPDNLRRNSLDVEENKDEVVEEGRIRVSENLGRGRRGRSVAVSKKDEILEPGLDGKIEFPDNARINCADVKENKDEIGVDNGVKVSVIFGRGRKSLARTSKKGEILDRGLEDERIEVLENSGGNSSDVKESKDKAVEDGSKVPANLERRRRGKSATVSKKVGVVQDDIVNTRKNLRRGRRTVPIQISEKDPSMDLILEDPVLNSSRVFVENENSEPPVEGCIEAAPKKLGRGRRNYKKDMASEDKSEASKTEKWGSTADVSEEDDILNLVTVDKNSVPKNDNLEPLVEASKNLGRGRRNPKKDAVSQDKNKEPNTMGKGRGRRTRSTKVSEVDENLNSVAEDKISVPNNAGRGRRTRISKLEETSNFTVDESGIEVQKKLGRGKQRAGSSKASKTDEMFNEVAEDAVVEEKPRADKSSEVSKTDEMLNVITEDAIIKEKPRRTCSSKASKTDEMFGVVVQNAVVKPKRRRADSSKVSKTDEMSAVAAKGAVVKEKPRKAVARNTRASSKVSKDEQLLKPPLDLKSSVLSPVENSYELKELKEDFHRLSKQAKIQQISLLSSSDADAKDKRSENNKEGKENCVSIECQKTEDDAVGTQTHKPTRVVPLVWNGNGIPNTTSKYMEDQKICWHGTPFEERVERALSDDKLFPQRNLTN